MRWTARALATPSSDTDVAFSIFFESQPSHKYLFNCGESTFKSIQQRKYGMSKFKAIFLTGVGVENTSGLPGFLMSLADSSTRHVHLTGPVGMKYMLASTRSYALRETLELSRVEIGAEDNSSSSLSSIPDSSSKPPLAFRDDNISVYGVPHFPSTRSNPSSLPSPAASSIIERVVRQMFSGTKIDESSGSRVPNVPFDWRLHRSPLPSVPRADMRVSYIGLGPAIRGKFDPKKADELGIKGKDRISPPSGELDKFTAALESKIAGEPDPTISPELKDLMKRINEEVQEEEKSRVSAPGDDVVVTTLGTGSALPSKYRNVLSTLVQIPKWGSILLDAGEGTWGQLSRRFGSEPVLLEDGTLGESPASAILRDVRCLFISHIHADHHGGLTKILAMRQQLSPPPSEPLYLVAGQETLSYIREFDRLQDLGLDNVRFIENSDIATKPSREERSFALKLASIDPKQRREQSIQARSEVMQELGLETLETVGVIHRGPCYGIVLRHQDGWSLAFSGDTVPCDSLVEAGKDVTLLIHEASLSNDELDLAVAKQHSTIGQALDVGRRMQAKNILLTHFSQRYPKMPSFAPPAPPVAEPTPSDSSNPTNLTPSSRPSSPKPTQITSRPTSPSPAIEPEIAIAFDCVSIPLGSMWKMSRYKPALERIFTELLDGSGEGEDDDEETALRASAMGVPTHSISTDASSASASTSGAASKKSPGKSSKKPKAREAASSAEIPAAESAAKKQKISANRSRAVAQ
ncbi:Metallo-hydrolase/oxidoreductase [Clavulina sp. PMI_390]|nr:Metallo-hydrolase/oxidoreductase [Clavulina sp. PMI_390]